MFIIDYDILQDTQAHKLVEKVKEKMKEGWQPKDPLFTKDSSPFFYQKIVKYDTNPLFEDII